MASGWRLLDLHLRKKAGSRSPSLVYEQYSKTSSRLLCALVITQPFLAGDSSRAGPEMRPPASGTANAEFLQAADEVLAEMSKILSLPVKEPLKKSVRSREEIREFLIRQMREDKDDTKRYADQKALEALGLSPRAIRWTKSCSLCSPNRSPDFTIPESANFSSPIGPNLPNNA